MFSNVCAQIKVYDKTGKKMFCVAEDLDIVEIKPSDVSIPTTVQDKKGGNRGLSIGVASLVADLIPTALKAGLQYVDSKLTDNVKKYEAEYSHSKSYLEAKERKMPDFSIKRSIWPKNNKSEDGKLALKFDFKAFKIKKIHGAMIYYIDSYELHYTKAKIKKNDQPDYSIVFDFVFLKEDGNMITQSISPIKITSVNFGMKKNVSKDQKYRTDFIILPADAFLVKISVKMIETNPRKISAEKALANWKAYGEYAKTGIDALATEGIKAINDRAEEDLWNSAVRINTPAAYRYYLNNTRKGTYKAEAEAKIIQLGNNNP